MQEWDLPPGLLLFDGDGHLWLALDYRNCQEEPPVVCVISDGPHVIPVAPSFAEFLRGLRAG